MREIKFRATDQPIDFNMERILLRNMFGYMITAYYKDGMVKVDGEDCWSNIRDYDSYILLKDLNNLL